MSQIVIKNLQSKTIHYNDKTERLLDILLKETDWMHACGGKGRCTSCKAIIEEGSDKLPGLTENEVRFAKMNRLADDERLTCQVIPAGASIVIKVPEMNKLPHLEYTE